MHLGAGKFPLWRNDILFSFNPRKQQKFLVSFEQSHLFAEVTPKWLDFASLKLASPSKPSCIKVSKPHIAMTINQVGILIEAFGSGGTQ